MGLSIEAKSSHIFSLLYNVLQTTHVPYEKTDRARLTLALLTDLSMHKQVKTQLAAKEAPTLNAWKSWTFVAVASLQSQRALS